MPLTHQPQTSPTTPRRTPLVGQRVELARYRTSAGERILHGQRVEGVVRVTDAPSNAGGRSYLVERGLEEDGYSALRALVADYVAQSQQRDEPAVLVPDLD
jgi:hypothetical protein